MKCNDCGETLAIKRVRPLRRDVCDGCWDTRGELVSGKIIPFTDPRFLTIQKLMTRGRGTSKKFIDKIRVELAGEVA